MPPTRYERDLASLFRTQEGLRRSSPRIAAPRFSRTESWDSQGNTLLTDRFLGTSAECLFLRTAASDEPYDIFFSLSGHYKLSAMPSGGWLIASDDPALSTFWIPRSPMLRRIDDEQHILEEAQPSLSRLSIELNVLGMAVDVPEHWHLDIVIWRFAADGGQLAQRLIDPLPIELQPVFLWGSHTSYTRPADLYLHLIHGALYENRRSWPYRWKICSENDAHALFVTLQGIHRATGNPLYEVLKRQLLLSVIDRQATDGGWYHGEWTRAMESHFRLHCSGMHMLMDALSEEPDSMVEEALSRAASYVIKRSTRIDAGTWFLHDSLELNEDGMAMSPTPWVRSEALGKSVSNMLVLNTHLDTTVALDRYRQITGDNRYAAVVRSAADAAKAVLTARPQEWLFRSIFAVVKLSFLPTAQASRLPTHQRALKRIGWKYLIPALPWIKARWPRLVMPGGYVDRALTLHTWSDVYHSINLMDLVRFQRRFGETYLQGIIAEAFALVRDFQIGRRWSEQPNKIYGLGFWAESLYQACTLSDAATLRKWLAEAVFDLADHGMGLPPSIFGTNCEAIDFKDQIPSSLPGAAHLRIVNLSRNAAREMIFINVGNTPVPMREATLPCASPCEIQSSTGNPLSPQNLTVPSRDWVRITDRTR